MHYATLDQHLKSLRKYLIIFAIIFGLVFIGNIFLIPYTLQIIAYPLHTLLDKPTFVYLSPVNGFFSQMKIAFWFSVLCTAPFGMIQIFSFIYAGLKKNERILCIIFFILIPILFYFGVLLSYFYIIPHALKFLLNFGNLQTVQYFPEISSYITFILNFTLLFGLILLTPLIFVFLTLLNILSITQLKKMRKYILVIVFIIAAIFTPPDPISQIILALLLYIIFELAIFLSFMLKKVRQ